MQRPLGAASAYRRAAMFRPVRVSALRPEAVSDLPAPNVPSTPSISRPSVAPRLSTFANLGSDPEQQYFADGIASSGPSQPPRSQPRHFYTRIGVAPLLQSRTDEAIIWFEKARNRTPALPQIRARFAAAWPSAKPLTSPAFGWPGCRRNDLYSRGHAHQDISSMSSTLTPRPACRLFLAFPIRCRNRESLSRR